MPGIEYHRLHPSFEPQYSHFPSRRSTVFSTKGAVATSQPLAGQAGIEILNKGGNAADAAVATAAAMNVCEPSCTGIGGDNFCLFYDAKAKKVRGINGSGRSPKALSLDLVRKEGITGHSLPRTSPHVITCPGAAAGWLKTIEQFGSGKLSMAEILAPAIRMARDGVPTHEFHAHAWQRSEQTIKDASPNWREMMHSSGTAPQTGWITTHETMADTFEAVAKEGHAGFYRGRVAQAIVDLIKSKGGVMTLEDLAATEAEVIEPLSLNYRVGGNGEADEGVTMWQCPPNGQGITALLALGIVEQFEELHNIDILTMEHNSTQYLHILIEAMRLAFADSQYYVADPSISPVPVSELLSKPYLRKRASLIDLKHAVPVAKGNPVSSSDTIYLTTSDSEGNACSFIASNYTGFGTGAVPKGCGFTLQNRGLGFVLEEGHPNCIAGGKRPYHTIIPGMVTQGKELLMSFGVMGGFMQPQGQVQVLLNKLRGFTPQSSLDAPRFCISPGLPTDSKGIDTIESSEIYVEEGIPDATLDQLRAMGHKIERAAGWTRSGVLGRGDIIQQIQDPSGRRVWAAASDLRGDGCAVGQI